METINNQRYRNYRRSDRKRKRNKRINACLPLILFTAGLFVLILIASMLFLLFPQKSNILLMGLDYSDPSNSIARTDTIILSTFSIPDGYIGILSIPRDLWVFIPNVGYNRINTAHYFAEINNWGSGPAATITTIEGNFGVDLDYYVRLNFEGFREIVDAMGGLDIVIPRPMAGYEPGEYHLTGRKTLAFVRNRLGSDDFFRMERGQLVLNSIYKQLLKPTHWLDIPGVMLAFYNSIQTDIPFWMWPRLMFTLMRTGIDNIDNQIISREMTSPFVTENGANVLLPQWELIYPLIDKMFDR